MAVQRCDVRSMIAIALTYSVALAGPILYTRIEGGVACLWVATAVLGPYLARLPLRRWTPILVMAAIASATITTGIGLGPVAAGPLALVNVVEAALVALLLRWSGGDGARTLGSLRQVTILVLGGAAVAALSGLPGAAFAAWVTQGAYAANWQNWFAGHFLGLITFAPMTLLVLHGDVGRWLREANGSERMQATGLFAAVTATSAACFAQGALPLLFLPLLPVMIATFRVGRIGGAASIMLLSAVTTMMTMRGEGPIATIDATSAFRVQFAQFYLAAVVLTVLPAAADLSRRKDMQTRLVMSEARYRLVMENATDVILNVDRGGFIRFISDSVETLGGQYRAEALIGTRVIALVHPADAHLIRDAHCEALRRPGRTLVIEYRAADGPLWLEARIRAIETEPGATEIVCAVRDISKRKAVEAELTRAALTDPLTGLGNRRAFNEAVDAAIVAPNGGAGSRGNMCIALFDLDHFKRINDAHGHDAGDRVIQRFAEVASRVTRGGDLVARLGGEEFGVLLRDTGEMQARALCDRLRREFGAGAVAAGDGEAIHATVSVGVARIDSGDERVTAMRSADAALYEAKRCGRNRLVLAA